MISSPVSTVYAKNALDHDPPFGDETRNSEQQIKPLVAYG